MDIGTVAVTANNGTSSSQHIAVVVGNGFVGPASTTTTCPQTGQEPVLAVVNVSQTYTSGSPLTPQLIGFLPLTEGATDVTLNGVVALVSTGGNILLVNLENPAQPALAGTITGNFGNWLTINSSGLIVGSSNSGGEQWSTGFIFGRRAGNLRQRKRAGSHPCWHDQSRHSNYLHYFWRPDASGLGTGQCDRRHWNNGLYNARSCAGGRFRNLASWGNH